MTDSADRIIDHYERHAAVWDVDRNRDGAWQEKPWHDRFIGSLPEAARVLDIGCGSGAPVARHLVDNGLMVTGIDSSPRFIDLCRQRLPDHEFLVRDTRSLHLDRRFDGVLAWDSFFHLTPDDQRRVVRQNPNRSKRTKVFCFFFTKKKPFLT